MKKVWSIFRTGLIALIPLFILGFIAEMLFGIFARLSFRLADGLVLNYLVNIFLWAATIFLIGWFLGVSCIRNALHSLLNKIPVISGIANYFLDNEYLEIIQKGHFPVVSFAEVPGSRRQTFGIVTKEEIVKQGDSEEIWCYVFIPSWPLPFTGRGVKIPKSELEYINSDARDLSRLATSFGMKGLSQKKKSR